MKKLLLILAIIAASLALFSCVEEEPEIPVPNVSITETIVPGYGDVVITCVVRGNFTAENLTLEYSADQSLASVTQVPFRLNGTIFTARITGLDIQKTYYYRYVLENKLSTYTDKTVRSFSTLDYQAPTVTTGEVSDVSGTMATLHASFSNEHGKSVSERGFYYGKDKNNLKAQVVSSDDFSLPLSELEFGTTYYYQAYAVSEAGTGKGEIKAFQTRGRVTFKKVSAQNITATSMELSGGVENNYGITVDLQGFRYSEASSSQYTSVEGMESATLSSLTPATNYTVWYYVNTIDGEFESDKTVFTTLDGVVRVTTLLAGSVNSNSAMLRGSIDSDGGSPVTERGFYYGDSERLGTKVVVPGAGTDDFQYSLSNLEKDKRYYYRAYAQNAHGTAEGDIVSFTTTVVQVSSVSLDYTDLTLTIGSTHTLSATITPAEAFDKSLTWESSNPAVATVDNNGLITAVNAGIAIITVTSTSGAKTAECQVKVKLPVDHYLTFKSEGTTQLSLSNNGDNAPILYYSFDKTIWTQWDYSELTFTSTNPLYLCGDNPDGFSKSSRQHSTFVATGSKFGIEGSVMSLLKKDGVEQTTVTNYTFNNLFSSCSLLVTAPSLPATTLATGCYLFMFEDCTSLATAPSLPATMLEYGCYFGMFVGCTSLEIAPSLPATTLAENCYLRMFEGCTGLEIAPSLPATTLAENCYYKMFRGCATLKTAPSLPATRLAPYCYQWMFYGCTSLEIAPSLPATKLESYCYYMMFYGCTSLNYVKCLATDISAENCVADWLINVSPSGTFIADAGCDWPRGYSGIPDGWTVNYEGVVPVTSVTLNKSSISLTVGQSETLIPSILPDNATIKAVTWSSSNTSVATVSSTGVVTAKAAGTATITVKTNDGNKTATCSVTVNMPTVSVTGVSLNKASLSLDVGATETLTATISPSNATNKTVTWISSDISVAPVSSTGVVTAKAVGTATITVKTADGNKIATCSVTVQSGFYIEATDIVLHTHLEDACQAQVEYTIIEGSTNQVLARFKGSYFVVSSYAQNKYYKAFTDLYQNPPLFRCFYSYDDGRLRYTETGQFVWFGGEFSLDVDRNAVYTVSQYLPSIGRLTAQGNISILSSNHSSPTHSNHDESPVSSHAYVDLGLPSGLKWATCNLCETGLVSSPEDYGDYYAWGETEPYYSSKNPLTWKNGKSAGYNWATYQWCNGSSSTLTRYNTISSYGTVDNKTEFSDYNYADDAARQTLGGKWRIPTDAEWTELRTKCTWTWTTQNGVNGTLVTGPNGNSIFLPDAGSWVGTSFLLDGLDCNYWSSSLSYAHSANLVSFVSDHGVDKYNSHRCTGRSVHPVTE